MCFGGLCRLTIGMATISIKSDALWSSGDGSPENPYEIVYN